MNKPINLDKYVFRHLADKLRDAPPERVCEYYIRYFVFANAGYLEYLTKEYKLPSDFLKMHDKIVSLT